ncbi:MULTISPECIES: efflux RND transporter periplasmic adaptor subunit [Lelliottia]|uniref:Efflux RND transporter periplasmic adaptor subunit n=1 Tax=Lelliottia aquatilis TaxID=2080838 RepID=A0ABX5A2U2_9ENTR|nr:MULTISPECIES: efflux RND transporter periplasmic adaptor subunit [Lelliottia]NTZ46169.1 efflux RND transporter periplasmic adaptor subunit [Lelliottia aquatilis]POZ22783.1 efflux RND transporter periplasmic adaptor subunit [Lelliottia aquatilis]POZ25419.1 efflux RND transporter periplasmic adaptor subunit [Lelliottia sp. 7254-16]POZ26358.1 efflux RND transporter periplasmic adaptor subunit [Lelliottia aquatilis]POZ32346.1 efflux RND transporter periplasmic adaptor subunit [Lelliottia aquati
MKSTFLRTALAAALLSCTLQTAIAAAIPVRVAVIEETTHAAERQIPGRIEAIHTVELRARTEGAIAKIHFRDGQYVKQGDLLFELDDAEPRAAVRLAQAEVKSAEATLRQAQQQLTRFQSLKTGNAISRNDVDTAQMQRDVARAALEQANARLEARNVTLGFTRITSPINGRMGHSQFHVGSVVNPSSGTLVEVVQLDPIRIAFALEEGAFAAKAGQHADLTALKKAWLAQIPNGDQRENGTLTSVDNRIDPRTASVMLRAEFANPQHRLLPGGNVNVWLRPQSEQDALAIPAAAVQQNGDGFFTWVVNADGKAEKRALTLGGQMGQQFTVQSGVEAHERVVTDGAPRLQPGAAVQILN